MSSMPYHPESGPEAGGMRAKVEMYTTRHCGYCVRAKQLLQAKGITCIEHALDGDDEARRRMTLRAGGRRSVPQIFINDRAIGGYIELYQLERAGELDALLAEGPPGGGA